MERHDGTLRSVVKSNPRLYVTIARLTRIDGRLTKGKGCGT